MTTHASPLALARLTVTQTESRYGTRRPQIDLALPRGTSHRQTRAALHLLAAAVQLATPAGEGWCVQTELTSDTTGTVYLELLDDREGEAKRGRAMLTALVVARSASPR